MLALRAFGLQELPDGSSRKEIPEVDSRSLSAIERGLAHLARQQMRNGSFPTSVPVAGTSLICLAFMGAGDTPERGRHAENIRRGLAYLMKCSSKSGFIAETSSGFEGSSGMHGHGYATLFLAESLGMIESRELHQNVRDTLHRAVDLIERVQNRFGGWNAAPDGTATDDGSGAIAIMQVTALRAARNAGLAIDMNVIDKAKRYIQEMTDASGWYAYNYNMRGSSHRSSALTGAGMYMMGALGLTENEKYEKGIKNLMDHAPFLKRGVSGDSGWGSWWYYTCFNASLAVYQRGGKNWQAWWPACRDELLRHQTPNGLWPNDSYGGVFSAFALLTLELPMKYLPFFQDGGRGAEGD